jgi:hypothetical protein
MMNLDFPLYAVVFFAVAALTGLLLRPVMRHWSDPIWVVILQCAFSLTTVFYSYYFWGTPRGAYSLIVIGLHASFVVGSLVFNRLIPPPRAPDPADLDLSSRFLRTFLALSVAVLICVLLIRIRSGLFIFADDPELAKTLAKRSGGGYLYRITLGLSITTPATLITLVLMKKKIGAAWKWTGWLLPLFLTVTTGFKADLLFSYAAVFYAAFYVLGQQAERRIKPKYSALTLLSILAVFAVTIGRRYTAVPVGPGFSKLDFTVASFIGRFVLNGAGLNHYLSQAIKSFSDLSPAAFVKDNLFVPFLAPLGLMRYPLTLGSRLGLSMTGSDVFGPNPTMYMEGLVYFGTIGAFFYCFTISALLFVHRLAYFAITRHSRNNFGVAIVVSSYFAAIALTTPVDFTLWMAGVTTFAFIVLPLLLMAMLISRLSPASTGHQNQSGRVDRDIQARS